MPSLEYLRCKSCGCLVAPKDIQNPDNCRHVGHHLVTTTNCSFFEWLRIKPPLRWLLGDMRHALGA